MHGPLNVRIHWLLFIFRVTAGRYLVCCGSVQMDKRSSHRMLSSAFEQFGISTQFQWEREHRFVLPCPTKPLTRWDIVDAQFSSLFTFRVVFVLQYFWTRTLLYVEFYAS